jgi:hypothetical protein
MGTTKRLKPNLKDPNQRDIMNLYPKRTTPRKSLSPTYYPISHHIYYDGHSFRVRVRNNGVTISVNTQDKQEAFTIREDLL